MTTPADKQIRQFYQRWFETMEKKDIEGFLKLLTDEFYLKSPGQPPITHKSKLREGLAEYHDNFTSAVDWQIEDLRVFNTEAIVRVREKVTLKSVKGTETSVVEGVHMALLVNTNDGWKVKTDVSSLDHPVSTDR
ncbi:MAG: nuclear transport factor 2 family protein [Balneolaceae bacterium]|nr:nuclear transport factor 2 family protein [Balneolaceae bacterium]